MSEATNTVANTSDTSAKRTERKAKRDTNSVASLLESLRKAAARGDASAGKKIRRKLRKAGHYGGLRERESSDIRIKNPNAKRTSNAKASKAVKRTRTSKRTSNAETAAQTTPIDTAPPTHPVDQMAENDA